MKLLFLLFLLFENLFAIITIVPIEIGAKPGVSGKFEAGLNTNRGYTDTDYYKTALRLKYDQNYNYALWSEFSGEYGKAGGIENINRLYAHIRLIHALSTTYIRDEYFIQGQENKFKALKKRRLAGGGLRFRLFETFKRARGYIGLGAMYEYIRHTDPLLDPNENNIRLNTYFAYTAKFNEDSHLAYTLYYQPKIDNTSDYVLSNKFELQLHIYLKLFLKLSVYYNADSVPPTSIDSDYGFGQSTTFVLDF